MAEAPAAAPPTGLSGAELKKRAKAEKAARRAQEKQSKGGASDQAVTQKPEAGGAKQQQKPQHKKTGSVSTPLPIRPNNPSKQEPPAQIPKKKEVDNKHVALFGHLYGHPRRATIAAAGKDVHPAILALGLQMSNYVICGSNARCVATLLAFKRVSLVSKLPSP
jgi:translation initiation factor eIF-2B subunit delta